MAAQQLNVRVGLLFDEKSLANMERQMRSSGQRLSKIGTDLTLSLSLPLAAFGVTAIKAAGDMESLTLALKSQLGSADAAAKEFDKLNEAAKNPGLGVEQAVRGSVRLQGVGFAAEEARQVLIQMGNAIASTGGTADDLDSVTKQFAQMTSKGRVLQEDISVLSESMPGLAGLMQKTFGTANVEAIRNMGVTGKEFVLQITKAAEELPRVEGGIKNGIGNAIDSLKQSAAKVGFAINEAFDVTGAIESVSSAVLALAQGFSSLDPSVKNTVLSFAALAISIGPILKGYGAIKIFNSQLVKGWGSLVGIGYSLIGTTNKYADVLDKTAVSTSRMEGALSRVKLALGIVAIVVGVAAAVYSLSESFDAAEFASEQYAKAQKDIIAQSASEIGLVNQHFAALKDETKGRGEKLGIIDSLIKQYPGYLKGIGIESASISRLTEIQAGLNAQILRGVAERQKASAVTSIYEKQAQILLRIQQIRDGGQVTAGEASLINTGEMIRAGGIAEGVILKMQAQAEGLGNQVGIVAGQFDKAFGTIGTTLDPVIEKEYALRDAAESERDAHRSGILVGEKVIGQNKEHTLTKTEQNKALRESNNLKKDAAELEAEEVARGEAEIKMLREIQQAWVDEAAAIEETLAARAVAGNPIDTASQSPGGEQGLTLAPQAMAPDLAAGITAGTNALYAYSAAQLYAAEIQQELNDKTFNFQTGLSEVIATLIETGDVVGAAALAMGDAIGKAASEGKTSFAELAQAALGAAAKIVRAYIQQAVAAAVAKAIGSSIPFPFNLAAGAAAGGVAAALFTTAIGAIGVKGFARGTNNAPGGMALVGEQGPELINLPRGSQVFPTPKTNAMLSGMGGGNMNVSGEFTVRGTDLVLVLDRANNKNERFR
jgi:tape measure domain-containing protein